MASEGQNMSGDTAGASRSAASAPPVPSAPSDALTVIIAGGGTGGHIYPGIAIAQEFKRRDARTRVLFVGTAKGLETRVLPREGFDLELIEVTALKRVGLFKVLRSLLKLPAGFWAVRSLIDRVHPDAVIGVGGYASGPVVLMAAMMGVPTMVAEQNALPGFTNRVLARFVRAAAVSFEEARDSFRGKAEVTGNPVRAEFFAIPAKDPSGRLNALITGGSQGARAINDAVIGALPLLMRDGAAAEGGLLAFTHQTGEADYDRVRAVYLENGIKADVKPFIEEMVAEFSSADLVICRAGATTVAELAAAGKPAILIPFPFAADDHQRKNAEAFERAGAGRMILQAELTPERLAQELLWLARDPQQLKRMSDAGKALGRPAAAARVVDLAMGIIGTPGKPPRMPS
ncbi:MAG: undecaprenyldiphospho-muramoylpentapeptide beta-N-acetylglucosaminyltransferase [Blastocatellia bacterium]